MRSMFKSMIDNGAMKSDDLIEMRDSIGEKFDAMGESLIKSTAISYTISADKKAGVDVDKIQTKYLWASGFRMILMEWMQLCEYQPHEQILHIVITRLFNFLKNTDGFVNVLFCVLFDIMNRYMIL